MKRLLLCLSLLICPLSFLSLAAQTELTTNEAKSLYRNTSKRWTSIHDPSVVYNEQDKRYYIFGSHKVGAYTTDMQNWTAAHPTWNSGNSTAFTKPAVKKAAKQLPAKAGFTVYTVQDGDILGRISKKHGTTMKAIMAANNLASADKIRAGQQLYIPVADGAVAPTSAPAASSEAAAPAPIAPSVEDNAEFLSGFTN